MDWIKNFLEQSDEEKALYAEIDKLQDEHEQSAETLAYRSKVHDIMEKIKKISHQRRERIRAERHIPEKTVLDEDAKKKLRERIQKRKEEEFARMPQTYIEAVLAYRKLSPELKRKFAFETFESDVRDIPRHENPKTTEKDISDLQRILVQDVIDFLNERGLNEVDAVDFGVDGLRASLPYEEWTPASDSSIRFEGISDDEIPCRTIIGTYM